MNCRNCGSSHITNGKCDHCGGLPGGGYCSRCMASIPANAKFCPACGAAPQTQTAPPVSIDPVKCPDCLALMQKETIGGENTLRCARCFGIWLPTQIWKAIQQKAADLPDNTVAVPKKTACDAPYRRCPHCGEMMARKAPGDKMPIIDICPDHGVWLDHGELELAVAAIKQDAAQKTLDPQPEQSQGVLTALVSAGADKETLGTIVAAMRTEKKQPEWEETDPVPTLFRILRRFL